MYTAFLTFKYLRRRISALPTLLAVIFGVATLFTVLSVMEGYRVKLRELVRGLDSHLILVGIPSLSLVGAEEIEKVIQSVPAVEATAPFLETIAMYRSFGRFSYFHLKGIEPLKEARVGDLEKHLLSPEGLLELERILAAQQAEPLPQAVLEERLQTVLREDRPPLDDAQIERLFSRERRLEVLKAARPDRPPDPEGEIPAGIVVGIHLLLEREVFLGDELKVITLSPDSSQPLTESFVVVGAFKSGEFETDSRAALILKTRMQNFLGLWDEDAQDFRAEGLRIALKDYRQADPARQSILRALARKIGEERMPDLKKIAERVSLGFGEDRIDSLARELVEQLSGPGNLSLEEVRSALREGAGLLAAPELRKELGRRMEESFHPAAEEFFSDHPGFIAEMRLVRGPLEAAAEGWEEVLLRGSPPRDLKLASRRQLILSARTELEAQVRQLIPRPLLAQLHIWEERQQVLLQAVKREMRIVGFLVILLNFFIGCIVFLMLFLMVIEKTRDTGILLALGATTRGVVAIFLGCGVLIVALGVLLGLLAGYYFVENINFIHDAIFAATGYKLFDPEIYKLNRLPTIVSVKEVVLSVLPSLLFGLAASLIPAVWASWQDPLKAIHYE